MEYYSELRMRAVSYIIIDKDTWKYHSVNETKLQAAIYNTQHNSIQQFAKVKW